MDAELRRINAPSLSLLISGRPGTKKKLIKKRKKLRGQNLYILASYRVPFLSALSLLRFSFVVFLFVSRTSSLQISGLCHEL